MVTAIIQARMRSRRLPGKVLKTIRGKPVLAYQVAQLKKVDKLDKIIVVTTTNEVDDPIVEFCEKESLAYFRGSEDNVLERFYQAAKFHKADAVFRITADCPLLDSAVCDGVISAYLSEDTEFVHTGLTFAEGLDCEIFSFHALEEAYHNAKLKSEREHATLYFHNRPDQFKKITYENKTDDSRYRFTIDEPEDFEVVKAIIEQLPSKEPGDFTADKVKTFLDNHPDIFRLNSHVIRNEGLAKSLREDEEIK